MVAPQPVFQNIAEEITQYIQKADSEILVNVPWFTDQSLFEQLMLKAKVGVAVSIGIEDDNINEKPSFQHKDIVNFGGRLYLHQTRGGRGINHEKYCVIDQRFVIFGSYNWTIS
ncbi:phospholipase D-like domain-containing protein, partial [Persicitalea sp.]|uniref:phospholipase D-like domain-containing protein n=1 Tax=Persicitalea sp. TaxID=3100273 RepID=UPI0035934792